MSDLYFKPIDGSKDWQKIDTKSLYGLSSGLPIGNYDSNILGQMRRISLDFTAVYPDKRLENMILGFIGHTRKDCAKSAKDHARREIIVLRRIMRKFQQRKGYYGKD